MQNNERNLLFARIFALFVTVILINSNIAVAAEAIAKQSQPEISQDATFSCLNESLSKEEAQRLFDLAAKGFEADEFNSGKPAKKDREKLDQNNVLLEGPEGTALRQEVPSQKMSPDELAHLLNTYYMGPFAIGVDLSDTFRLGRCKETDKNNMLDLNRCYLFEKNLVYRNSAQGIVKDVGIVWDDLKSIFLKKPAELTQEEFETLRARFAKETGVTPEEAKTAEEELKQDTNAAKDTNKPFITSLKERILNSAKSFKYSYLRRKALNPIQNTMLADSFRVTMLTNCTSGKCLISTYSLFDKFYNSWFSTELVLSNFGPVLFGEASRLLAIGTAKGWLPDISETRAVKWLRAKFMSADSWYGRRLAKQYWHRVRRGAFGEFWDEWLEDPTYQIFKGTDIRKRMRSMMAEDGILGKIKDLEKRRELVRSIAEMRSVWRAEYALLEQAEKQAKKIAAKQGQEAADLFLGQQCAKRYSNLDDLFNLDMPDYIQNSPSLGLYDIAFRDVETGEFIRPIEDPWQWGRLVAGFGETGDFSRAVELRFTRPPKTKDEIIKLPLYKASIDREVAEIPVADLENALTKFKDYFVRLDNGKIVRLSGANLERIKKHAVGGTVKIYSGGYEHVADLTPHDFAKIMIAPRIKGFYKKGMKNLDDIYSFLRSEGYGGRRYWSLLDRAIVSEQKLLDAYFSLKGGVKWSLYPLLYWGAKRGFGIQGLSAYMLPYTFPSAWKKISLELEEGKIYNDAYVDLFAQAGSDEGDILIQVIRKLPWLQIYDYMAKLYKPAADIFNMLLNKKLRTKVENLAFYATSQQNCDSCRVILRSNDLEFFKAAFEVPSRVRAYVWEDTLSEEARKQGSTIIAFAHHTNLNGLLNDKQTGKIELDKAISEKKTCRDAVKKAFFGWDLGHKVAGIMAAGEAVTYAIFGTGAGIFGSLLQQIVFAPKLAHCIDTDGGYYIHLFVPSKEILSKDEKRKNELSTENVAEMVRQGAESFLNSLKFAENTTAGKKLNQVRRNLQRLVENAKSIEVAQANIEASNVQSELVSQDVFYFWFKGQTQPSSYRTQGKRVLIDKDNNQQVSIDFKKGKILVDGKEIVFRPDIVRLSSINTDIPADEVPQRITKAKLNLIHKPIFMMDASGNVIVPDSSLLRCIKQGVLEQTGLELTSTNLREVFGLATAVITTTHNIIPKEKRIIASGATRFIADGSNAKAIVYADANVEVIATKKFEAGSLESIQFQYGVIIYNPKTNELIIWLRHNSKGILTQNDVSGLRGKLVQTKNPLTDCPEPAVELEALPVEGSDQSKVKVDAFNKAIKKVGPFQILETPTKRFIIYSKLVDGECKDFFKIIDKRTGDVYESEIKNIVPTDKGIEIETKDGKKHNIEFSTENGVPKLKYDNLPPETLVKAQGKNGSFYYDPERGLWIPENAQLLPLLEAFRQNGVSTQVAPGGNATSTATGNTMNVQIAPSTASLLDLPTTDRRIFPLELILLICAILTIFVMEFRKRKFKYA
ncbi:MAG: hypothetical protein J7L14_01415 [Candidatus Diapherotrites archaeon]|nr:hypothetical protein [Candidatus Diapherotrites archaeon]